MLIAFLLSGDLSFNSYYGRDGTENPVHDAAR
jgi:hypothetical protein